MTLIALAWLGGLLTIVSPCILPVLPFVFSRAGQPFRTHGLPMLAAMAVTFALVASLAAVGGGWVVEANQYGRRAALALLAVFGLALLWPRLAERLARPLVAAGERLAGSAGTPGRPRIAASLLLGVATGLLWAPCAGPILGLILTGAALHGASADSTSMLFAFAAGAATALAAALLLGGRVLAALRRSLGVGEWLRRGLGGAMLAGVAMIALGLDTGLLGRLSTIATGGIEQRLVDRLAPRPEDGPPAMRSGPAMTMPGTATVSFADSAREGAGASRVSPIAASWERPEGWAMMPTAAAVRVSGAPGIPDHGAAPALDGATQWLNGSPLTAAELRGKVVLVDFWTYACINCLRALPYVKTWHERYRDQGLVVVGVHAPEFAFERDPDNVSEAVRKLGIGYPVAIDNRYAIWRAFGNHYWPALYLIDTRGHLRYWHFGEGRYAETERIIRTLLKDVGASTPG